MSDKVKDILIRALKTFWQAAVAYLIASATVLSGALDGTDTWTNVLITLGVGAVAAGLSAAWNAVIKPLLTSNETAEAIEGAVSGTILEDALTALGIDLEDITVAGLEKVADTFTAILDNDDLKDDIITKIKAALGITEETTA